MGTLTNQAPRNHRKVQLDEFLTDAVKLAEKHKIAVSDVIAASQALEFRRRNDLYVDDGDAFDEQIGGIGALLQQLCSAVENFKKDE